MIIIQKNKQESLICVNESESIREQIKHNQYEVVQIFAIGR